MLEKTNLMNMCMVCDGDNVVVIDRRKPNWPGVTFPGSHVEKDESLTDSVIREVKEETGLSIDSPILCGITDWCNENDNLGELFYRRMDDGTWKEELKW